MNDDPTESIRRARVAELNKDLNPDEKALLGELERSYGRVWTKDEVRAEYEITGFMAPLVVVRHKTTGEVGSFEFTHLPRFYFNYQKDK